MDLSSVPDEELWAALIKYHAKEFKQRMSEDGTPVSDEEAIQYAAEYLTTDARDDVIEAAQSLGGKI